MPKKLIIINGTMGAGKTAVCRELYTKFDNSVWLDGDWCWMMHPWNFTEENKKMAMENIRFLLKSFLKNPSFEYIFFSWVIHREEIFDDMLSYLDDLPFKLYKISITCSEEELRRRLLIENSDEARIADSINRLAHYESMDTIKIDTTDDKVKDTVDKIIEIISA